MSFHTQSGFPRWLNAYLVLQLDEEFQRVKWRRLTLEMRNKSQVKMPFSKDLI